MWKMEVRPARQEHTRTDPQVRKSVGTDRALKIRKTPLLLSLIQKYSLPLRTRPHGQGYS
jgi:hypothetical protein